MPIPAVLLSPFSRRAGRGGLAACAALLIAASFGAPARSQAPPAAPDEIDERPPLPRPEWQPTPLPAKYRIDGTTAMFQAVEDENPLRSEKENADEYRAWNDVVLFARPIPAAELKKVADGTLVSEDLIQESRRLFRLRPIHFNGLLTKVQRVEPTKTLRDQGVKDVFMGSLTPADEPRAHEIRIVFTELPAGTDAVEKLADKWVSFAGYSFKLLLEPPVPDPKGIPLRDWKRVPMLIGSSLTVLPGSPVPEGDVAAHIPNKDLRIFQMIRDDAGMPQGDEASWPEAAAWNWVALYARKFPNEELEKKARKNLTFADLFEPGRRDYKLDLVQFKGRLIRLTAVKAPRRLRDAGVDEYYEGWLVPADEPRGNPICVVMTELPEGLEPARRLNRVVSFAGYSFKLLQYNSEERDKNDRSVRKRAPLLIGHSATLFPEPEPYKGGTWSSTFVPVMVLGFVLILGTAGLLSWWFRRGDAQVKQVLSERQSNPFGN